MITVAQGIIWLAAAHITLNLTSISVAPSGKTALSRLRCSFIMMLRKHPPCVIYSYLFMRKLS